MNKKTNSALLLVGGVILIVLSQMRGGAGLLAWVAHAPLLVFLTTTKSRHPLLWVTAALCLGWSLATVKIITGPLPLILAPAYGVPIALLQAAGYALWNRWGKGQGWLGGLVFAAAMVLMEWIQHRFTPLGSWGAAGYTQLESLVWLQGAALGGLALIAFPMYWTSALLAQGWAESRIPKRPMAVLAATVAILHLYGAFRLSLIDPQALTTVAAVGTDAAFGGIPLPTKKEIEQINQGLFERSRKAARRGAKLVSWTEAATMAMPQEEKALIERGKSLALTERLELVMAYVVPTQLDPLRYDNKFTWISSKGEVRHQYLKHEPVPGEPARRGTEAPIEAHTDYGTALGAICYDYDFPYLGLANARAGAGLVVLPSSDWEGIDPLHTQMASLRAIEGGYSLLRSTRFGLSAAYDSKGRVRAWKSANESAAGIMMAELPIRSHPTLYQALGDWPVYLSLMLLLGAPFRKKPFTM